MAKRVRPSRQQFEVTKDKVIHKPTDATWYAFADEAYPHLFVRSMLGSVLPNGDDYREDEVTAMALELLRERLKK
jgi:hypothetical protein